MDIWTPWSSLPGLLFVVSEKRKHISHILPLVVYCLASVVKLIFFFILFHLDNLLDWMQHALCDLPRLVINCYILAQVAHQKSLLAQNLPLTYNMPELSGISNAAIVINIMLQLCNLAQFAGASVVLFLVWKRKLVALRKDEQLHTYCQRNLTVRYVCVWSLDLFRICIFHFLCASSCICISMVQRKIVDTHDPPTLIFFPLLLSFQNRSPAQTRQEPRNNSASQRQQPTGAAVEPIQERRGGRRRKRDRSLLGRLGLGHGHRGRERRFQPLCLQTTAHVSRPSIKTPASKGR